MLSWSRKLYASSIDPVSWSEKISIGKCWMRWSERNTKKKKIIFYLHKNDDGNEMKSERKKYKKQGKEGKTLRKLFATSNSSSSISGSNVLTFMVIHFMKLKSEFGRNSISLLLYGYAINVIGPNAECIAWQHTMCREHPAAHYLRNIPTN